jgi:hypothetical protein
MKLHPPDRLLSVDDLILPDGLRQALRAVPRLLADGQARALVVRGPQHNGRRTLLGAVARALGRGLVEVTGLNRTGDERWRLTGLLATLLHAVPAVVFELAPGESAEVPALAGCDGPVGLVLGRQGGLTGPGAALALPLTVDIPDPAARRLHWRSVLGPDIPADLDAVADRCRLTSGNIRRVATLARPCAALAGRTIPSAADVRQASRALNRQALDTLATYLPPAGDWTQLAVAADTLRDLRHLEARCRAREQLGAATGPVLRAHLNAGVRALFIGPSGTGKTLAARLLASALEKDLYRLDLSAVVNKYIGETEKSLNQLLARAEELDVVLLLDEGDALLTQRTGVQSANDRYANLETNFLLQRLETFEGILLVTTNAPDRIDGAFQRRMDAVVAFRPPEAAERWTIWQSHLPADHRAPPALLRELALRCALTGGQIRSAVLHAATLALQDGGVLLAAHLEAAVQSEYRKAGGVCPVRATAG